MRKQELEEDRARLLAENGLLSVALNLLVNDERDARETFTEECGGRYTINLYGATRADGGIVLLSYKPKADHGLVPRSHTTAHYLETLWGASPSTPLQWQIRGACERLMVARQRLLDAEREAERAAGEGVQS